MLTTELMADMWRLLMILAGVLAAVVVVYSGYMMIVCIRNYVVTRWNGSVCVEGILIKPCPCCGSSHVGVGTVEQGDSDVYFVVCRVCRLTSGGSASKAGAIRKWNKRID